MLEPLSADRHAGDLFDAQAGHDALWIWMPYGPFADCGEHHAWVAGAEASTDPVFFAILDPDTGRAGGHASFLRIERAHGAIEIGVLLTPALQRSRAASAALMAMIGCAMDHGYRRMEWKCNALNGLSRRAARRLGFTHEGTFCNHMIVKGRNRDSAWFSITDGDWKSLAPAHATLAWQGEFRRNRTAAPQPVGMTRQALPGRRDRLCG